MKAQIQFQRLLVSSRLLDCLCILMFFSLLGCDALWKSQAESYFDTAERLLDSESSGYDEKAGLAMLNRAIDIEPGNAVFLETRGMLNFNSAEYPAALSDLTRSCSNSRSNDSYLCNYIVGLTLGRLGRYQEARASFEAAIANEPGNYQYRNGLALAYLCSGQLEKALSAIEIALDAEPQVTPWRYTKGVILSKLSRKEEAIRLFSATAIYSRATNDGVRDEFFRGNQEYKRARAMSASDLQRLWHYFLLWPKDIEDDYPLSTPSSDQSGGGG